VRKEQDIYNDKGMERAEQEEEEEGGNERIEMDRELDRELESMFVAVRTCKGEDDEREQGPTKGQPVVD
jgi:hypothetical protein